MTIERALTRKDQFQDGTRLDSWMYRIMRNIWIAESRARTRRSQTFAEEEAGLAVGADGSQEASVALADTARSLARLPHELRETVMLVLVEGSSSTKPERAV